MAERVLLCLAHMSGNEMKYVQEAFDGNWVVPLGPNVNGFEKDLEDFVNTKAPLNPPEGGTLPARWACGKVFPVSAEDASASLPPVGGQRGALRGEQRRAYQTANPLNYDLLKDNAKRMRQNPTEAELAMWTLLRNDNLGFNFRRQHVIGDYIADFICLEKGLVIEVDGDYHNAPEQQEWDAYRTEFLKSQGYTVLRFTNEQVLHNIEAVEAKIKDTLTHLAQGEDASANFPPEGGQRGAKKVVALSAGTAAVHLALIACGVGPGDEVICQSFTFCASCHPITYLGAKPVLVDSEAETWNMDPDLLETAIKDRIAKTGKAPKAIIPVALYGMPYKIDRIMEIADRYGIPVIEDAAEGLGSRYRGQVLGTFGRYGVLSFNGNKMITTSGGGALICPDAEAAKKVMFYATQARESYPYYQHEEIGYNYRMSNICAGIGRGQMTILDEHIAHHQMLASFYAEEFAKIDGIEFHGNPAPEYDSNFWLNTIVLDPSLRVVGEEDAYAEVVKGAVGGAAGVTHEAKSAHTDCEPNRNVEAMRMALDREGIESRPLWKPMHRQPVYADAAAYVNGVSESLFARGLCLPSGPYVSLDDARRIVDTIRKNIK